MFWSGWRTAWFSSVTGGNNISARASNVTQYLSNSVMSLSARYSSSNCCHMGAQWRTCQGQRSLHSYDWISTVKRDIITSTNQNKHVYESEGRYVNLDPDHVWLIQPFLFTHTHTHTHLTWVQVSAQLLSDSTLRREKAGLKRLGSLEILNLLWLQENLKAHVTETRPFSWDSTNNTEPKITSKLHILHFFMEYCRLF